jgi:hypothetical protein
MPINPEKSAPALFLPPGALKRALRFVGLLVGLLLASDFRAGALGILVPAYFYPTAGGSWDALNRAADRVPLVAILNPNNGPSDSTNSDYAKAVNALRNAGGRVIGYVYSSYAARPLADVEQDIDRYHAFYAIDGFFIDEMSNDSTPAHLAYYQALYQYIKTKRSSYFVVGNPGINTPASYLSRPTVDGLVTFENDTGYAEYAPDPWTKTQPVVAFSHLCYDVPTADTMTNFVRLAVARNAGSVYVTDDRGNNPWDTLPSYWWSEVALVEAINHQAASNQPPVLSISLAINHAVQVGVLGLAGKYVLQASDNFTNWKQVATNVSPSGKFSFSDPRTTNLPARFYRTAQ